MKFRKIVWLGIAAIAIVSCDNGGPDSNNKISPVAKNFLMLKIGSVSTRSMASPTGYANAANESMNRLSMRSNLSFGRLKNDSTDTSGDTTYYPAPWITCAKIKTTVNSDGSTTTEYDYGTGCYEGNEYYQYLLFGKYSYTYFYENEKSGSKYRDHYFGSYTSDNYGGQSVWESDTSKWVTDGSSSYSGTSEYDTARNTFSGVYEYEGRDVSTYNGITYSYTGNGKGMYNENGGIIEKNDYSYSTADYSYSTYVAEPLVSRNDCSNYSNGDMLAYCFYLPVYVSGREIIKYKQGDTEGSFEIIYGDGKCDSKVTIIENGNFAVIDLIDLYSER
jgi:hypothetical protein